MKALKQKRCRNCREQFTPFNSFDKFCSKACEFADSEYKRLQMMQKAKREERKADAVAKDRRKTITEHAADTQKPVNAFIRCRDKDKGCISCDKPLRGTFHAGHYKPVGKGLNWFIRYHHDNIFGQCVQCNTYKAGNQSEMRKRILERIGPERLAWIEGPHPDAKFTVEQLKQIAAEHKQLLKEMTK